MKKNVLLIAVLAVLAGISWYVVTKDSKTGNRSDDFSYREFALDDLADLHKIVLFQRNAKALIFTRTGNQWTLNDRYKARENAMKNMLDVIKNIRIDYVPPNSATENIMKSFLKHGIKVELYDKHDKALKKYHVGSSPANGIGTYFVMDGYDKPLVMSLPSMKGNVHTRFAYKFNEWRDMTVFDFEESEIAAIEVSYPFNKKFSFKIEGKKIQPLHPFQKRIAGNANKKMIANYLSGFRRKVAEYIENENPRKDSIVGQIPFCELKITDSQNKETGYKFYYLTDKNIDTATSNLEAFSLPNVERFFIMTSWGDFYLGQHLVFKDLFWKYDSFFTDSPTS